MTATTIPLTARPTRFAIWLIGGAWLLGILAIFSGLVISLRSFATGQRIPTDANDMPTWLVVSWLIPVLAGTVYLSVGALILQRGAVRVIGLLCLALGLALALSFWLESAFWLDPGGPSSLWVLLLGRGFFQSWIGFVPILVTLFPTGRPPSRMWWVAIAITFLGVCWSAFFHLQLQTIWISGYGSVTSPLSDGRPAYLDDATYDAANIGSLAILLMLAASVISLVARWPRADTRLRQQITWLIVALLIGFAILIAGTMMVGFVGGMLGLFALTLGVPLAIAIAILRHRLYDIDVVLNRAIVYAGMSLFVVAAYVLGVGVLSALLGQGQDPGLGVSVLATGLIAVVFQPLRAALQRAVNRRLYGRRDEPMTVVAALGERFEAGDSDQALLASMTETITRALRVPYAEIVANTAGAALVFSGRAPAGAALEDFPLRYRGDPLGTLRVAPRAGERLSAGDRVLLTTLARQASLAAHAARARSALQLSREAIVAAREEERRRLRRDLHDGLGPTLASVAQRIDAAGGLTQTDPQAAIRMLADARAAMGGAIADLRQAAYALRPPSLDELGLVSAVREDAQRLLPPGGPALDVRVEGMLPPLSAAAEAAAYRIAMEAITNVIKHARATRCEVVFASHTGALRVDIADDGLGIAAGAPTGVGTHAMRERAEEMGGRVEIAGRDPHGTRVRAVLPIGHPEAA